MSTGTGNVGLGQVFMTIAVLHALDKVPEKVNTPRHYGSHRLAQRVEENNEIVEAFSIRTSEDWTGMPFKLAANTLRFWNYAFERPLAFCASVAEQFLRGDMESNVQAAERNLKELKIERDFLQKQRERLKPTESRIISMTVTSRQSTNNLCIENEKSKEQIQLQKKEIETLLQTHEKIDIEAAMKTLEKMIQRALSVLSNPDLISHLSAHVQALEESENNLSAAKRTLEVTIKTYQTTLSRLQGLLSVRDRLNNQKTALFEQLSIQAAQFQAQAKILLQEPQNIISHEMVSYGNKTVQLNS